MQLTTSEAILLDVIDLHEYDRIVSFLTPETGRKKGVAKGARRKYSRFAGQLQPLAKVEITWTSKDGSELVRVSSLDLVRSAEPLYRDLENLAIGGYLADHMLEFAQENEDSRRLYRLLDSTVMALLDGIDPGVAARYFEVWVLRLSGIFPVPVECPICGQSLLDTGATLPSGEDSIVCVECHPSGPEDLVSQDVLEFLIRSRVEGLEALADPVPDVSTLAGLEEVSGRIRRNFLQGELRSYRVMQQMLAQTGQQV
jgi:DNA repair protein RecO (recombination protein O)